MESEHRPMNQREISAAERNRCERQTMIHESSVETSVSDLRARETANLVMEVGEI